MLKSIQKSNPQTENKDRQPSRQTPMEDKTLVFNTRSEESLGPRLVCTTSNGKSKIVPLKLKKLIIGRSNEAALKLMHPSISRKHCVIEKRKTGFYARNISTTNPLFLNNREISEQRLFSGDKLQIGTFSITFISDEKADTRQPTQKIITKHTRSNRGIWLAALLIFIFSGYLPMRRGKPIRSSPRLPSRLKWETTCRPQTRSSSCCYPTFLLKMPKQPETCWLRSRWPSPGRKLKKEM